jgi:hypothetical protein
VGPECLQALELLPAQFNIREGATTGTVALMATLITILGVIEKYAAEFCRTVGEGHCDPPGRRISGRLNVLARNGRSGEGRDGK